MNAMTERGVTALMQFDELDETPMPDLVRAVLIASLKLSDVERTALLEGSDDHEAAIFNEGAEHAMRWLTEQATDPSKATRADGDAG